MPSSRPIRHIIKSQQFDLPVLATIFDLADSLRNGYDPCMTRKIMAMLFYEPSTRTWLSFQAAMKRLGGDSIGSENAGEFSSAAKGETLEDTIRVAGTYADLIVLRHDEKNEIETAERAARVSSVPVINAGCGKSQHPTQALLDLYTIRRERGTIDGTTIAILGDLKNGRTVRSLCYLIAKFQSIRIYFVSPPSLRIESDIREYLEEESIPYEEVDSFEKIIPLVDVVYTTRIQKERMEGLLSGPEFERLQRSYRIDARTVSMMQREAIIMHPLPRNDEIAREVDVSMKAAYFRQAENGLYVRMALLKWIFL